jgi:glycosyltransferase involved in cell wall biosynthesis
MRISIVIPALNEAESIGWVLDSLSRDIAAEVLVVDGGSTDGTIDLAQAAGARVIHEQQPGYGQACARGVAAASGELIVFMDADGADDPQYLGQLVQPFKDGSADMVLGTRLLGKMEAGAMPWHQYAGNLLSARLIRGMYGLAITDLSPFRCLYRSKLVSLNMQEMTFGWPTEMIVKAARQQWRIQEVPVIYRPRLGGKSKISGTVRGTVLATYFILRTILKYSKWKPI